MSEPTSKSNHPTISVVVITHDEEHNLPRCLKSVAWANEVIVVDSGSTDATREIAYEHGATVLEREFQGYGSAKAFGVEQAQSEWILSLDADEEVTDDLADEIKEAVAQGSYAGYTVPRLTNFLGRWIRHCGWYPDRVLRVFRRDKGQFDGAVVHERVVLNGSCGSLKSDLYHYSYPTLEHYFEKSSRYTTVGAEEAFRRGKRAGFFDLVIRPPVSFISHYFVRLGLLDGVEGFMVSVLSAMAVFVKYAKLRTLQRKQAG